MDPREYYMEQGNPHYLHINPNFRPAQKSQNVFVNRNFIYATELGNYPRSLPETRTHQVATAAPNSQRFYERDRNVSKYSWKGHVNQKFLNNPKKLLPLSDRLHKANELKPSGSKLPEKQEKVVASHSKSDASSAKLISHSTKDTKFKWKRTIDSSNSTSTGAQSTSVKSSTYSWSRRNSTEKTAKPKLPSASKSPHRVRRNSQMIISRSGKKLIRKNLLPVKSSKRTLSQFVSKYKISKVSKFKLDNRPDSQRTARKKTRASLERLFPRFNCDNFRKFKLYKRRNKYTNKTLVNIGGILYRATKSKLTRSTPDSSAKTDQAAEQNTTKISVGGVRFVLTNNGNTLLRVSGGPTQLSQQRVHFGGVTYESTSDDTMVRTNSHRARHLVSTARHRSIACLNAHKRKINTPCLVYRRIGRCARQESGMCPFTHVRNNVDVCKRFLMGTCTAAPCLLSHDAGLNKLPTCKFFLEGTCGRDNCPYLHVKVSDTADICRDFLHGFCPKGDKCNMRHFNICPEFEKTGQCAKGKQCPYPHPQKERHFKSKKSLKFTSAAMGCKKQAHQRKRSAASIEKLHERPARYYGGEAKEEDNIPVLPKMLRLAQLPSFIALEQPQSDVSATETPSGSS